MEPRKHSKYDLENKRGFFFQIGLLLALLITLTAFEWKSYDRMEPMDLSTDNAVVPEEVIPVTYQETPMPELLPEKQTKKTPSQVIEIVENIIQNTTISSSEVTGQDTSGALQDAIGLQDVEAGGRDAEIFTLVDEPPSFPGGEELRMKFLQKTTIYPKFARENKVQGTVYVTFIVEPDGNLTQIKILQGIGSGCDEEAFRVVKAMPKWNPGKKNGLPIRIQVTMPLAFTLQASN